MNDFDSDVDLGGDAPSNNIVSFMEIMGHKWIISRLF